jgi:hypothetical protein
MAFKMKGSPMYRNYGIGTPMKATDPVNPKPVKSVTSNVLDSLSNYGKGGANDPVVQAEKNASEVSMRGARIGNQEGMTEWEKDVQHEEDMNRVSAINAENTAAAEELRKTGADAKFIATTATEKNKTDQNAADKAADKAAKEARKDALLLQRQERAKLTPKERAKLDRKNNKKR